MSLCAAQTLCLRLQGAAAPAATAASASPSPPRRRRVYGRDGVRVSWCQRQLNRIFRRRISNLHLRLFSLHSRIANLRRVRTMSECYAMRRVVFETQVAVELVNGGI